VGTGRETPNRRRRLALAPAPAPISTASRGDDRTRRRSGPEAR